MSGTMNNLNREWDTVVGLINKAGLKNMHAYINYPADEQPH
jgi:hypothetical protein